MSAVHQYTSSSRKSKTSRVLHVACSQISADLYAARLSVFRSSRSYKECRADAQNQTASRRIPYPLSPPARATTNRARLSTALLPSCAAPPSIFRIDGQFFTRIVRRLLQRHDLPAPVSAIGRNQDLRLRVRDPVRQRRRAESSEHHRVHRADSRAGKHRDHRLGHHRHVNRHAVAGFHAQPCQRVRKFADPLVQFRVRELNRRSILGLPHQRRLVPVFLQVPIQAVVRDIQLPAHEPLRVRQIPFQGLHRRLEPLDQLRLLGPERFRIGLRRIAHSFWYSSIESTRAFLLNSSGGATAFSSSTCGSNSCITVNPPVDSARIAQREQTNLRY